MIESWVDGSFKDNQASWAFVVVTDNEIEFEDCGCDVPEEFLEHRNVAGEIFAVLKFIEFCADNDEKEAVIHYDYEGLEKWATGEWKTNKELTKAYKESVKDSGIKIKWIKIQGHSGDRWNEYADQLAKSALGMDLSEKPEQPAEEKTSVSAETPDLISEADSLIKENRYMEASLLLEKSLNSECSEELIKKYADVTMYLGEFYAKKTALICEEYIKTHPKSKVLKSYCYAIFMAYCQPNFGKDSFNLYMEAKKAIKKILSVSRHEKIINEFIFPFSEYADRMGDRNFIKSLPETLDINLFSKEKPNISGRIFPSKYDKILLLLKKTTK